MLAARLANLSDRPHEEAARPDFQPRGPSSSRNAKASNLLFTVAGRNADEVVTVDAAHHCLANMKLGALIIGIGVLTAVAFDVAPAVGCGIKGNISRRGGV